MKVRQGFVSNSSSSSFVAIVEKKDFEKYIKSCHEYIKFMLKDGYSKKEAKIAAENQLRKSLGLTEDQKLPKSYSKAIENALASISKKSEKKWIKTDLVNLDILNEWEKQE